MACSITEECIGCTACARVCPVSAIRGEKGSLHVINPSRCIECEACGRVCPKSAVLDPEGKTVARLGRNEWAKPVFDLSRCISCGACGDKCPVSCIELEGGRPGGLGYMPRLARPGSCVSCGYCAFYCPMSCIEVLAPPAVGTEVAL